MASLETIGGIHYEIMKRCYNEKSVTYKSYGAKGITVCDEWHDREKFRKWCIENGWAKGLRLERIDSKGNYEPSNCIFGTTSKKKTESDNQYHKQIRKTRVMMHEKYNVPEKYSDTRLYRIYCSMITRCENENHIKYNDYGGRGIKVCDEWKGEFGFFKFYRWAIDNGYSDKLTIDRMNNNLGYSPDNCKWSTIKEQIHNRRNSRNFIYKGQLTNLADISRNININYAKLWKVLCDNNVKIGDDVDKILEKISK